jgi:hypothetical protein
MNRTERMSILLMVPLFGCGSWESGPAALPPRKPAKAATAASAEPSPAATASPPAAAPNTAASQSRTVEKAAVGLGKKGHGYGGDIVTVPLQTRFRAEERIRLATVDYALKLFKAEHDRLPKSDAEFKDKIIRANQIPLPALPAGDEYWYDAEAGQLMVRHTTGGDGQ